jgi:hypothetical protein
MISSRALAVALAASLYVTPVFASSFPVAQCQSWFRANDRNGDGALGTGENVGKFYDRITLANEENDNYIMSRAFFVAECKIGSFGPPPN